MMSKQSKHDFHFNLTRALLRSRANELCRFSDSMPLSYSTSVLGAFLAEEFQSAAAVLEGAITRLENDPKLFKEEGDA